MDSSEALSGGRNRAFVDAVEASEELRGTQERRCRLGDLYLAFVARSGQLQGSC